MLMVKFPMHFDMVHSPILLFKYPCLYTQSCSMHFIYKHMYNCKNITSIWKVQCEATCTLLGSVGVLIYFHQIISQGDSSDWVRKRKDGTLIKHDLYTVINLLAKQCKKWRDESTGQVQVSLNQIIWFSSFQETWKMKILVLQLHNICRRNHILHVSPDQQLFKKSFGKVAF